jgi:mono/diheme cytochrome c family protein
MLTDRQIDALVRGIRSWAKSDVLPDTTFPPYAAQAPGDPQRGADVYRTYCSSCHGIDGRGGRKASSIVDGSYLALVSDQQLRTIVIAGRPELGAPDWRSDIEDLPMSPQEIADVVAWLSVQRPQFQGHPYTNSSAGREKEGLR